MMQTEFKSAVMQIKKDNSKHSLFKKWH